MTLIVPAGCDFDIWVSTSTALTQNQAGRNVPLDSDVARSISGGSGDDEDVQYTAADSREYYIAIHGHSGTGAYTLESNLTLEEHTPAGIPSYPLLIIASILAMGILLGIARINRKRRRLL